MRLVSAEVEEGHRIVHWKRRWCPMKWRIWKANS